MVLKVSVGWGGLFVGVRGCEEGFKGRSVESIGGVERSNGDEWLGESEKLEVLCAFQRTS